MKNKFIITMMVWIGITCSAMAQKAAIKTNLLYDATTTINLGVELSLAPRWTLDISGNYNPWTFSDNRKWQHWLVQPEARYWFCNKMMGHFLGFHLLGGAYNVGAINADFKFLGTDFSLLRDHRYEGWMIGTGVAYGYAWTLSRHWNIEAEVGLGYIYLNYDKYKCEKCGEKIESDNSNHYVGPTKAAINLIYVF